MDESKIRDHLKELKNAPVNELNIRRLAEVTTALKNFEMLEENKVIIELEETQDAFRDYLIKKRTYHKEKTKENAQGATEALKSVLLNIEESIKELWSECDSEEEKGIIKDYLKKMNKRTE